MFPTKSASDVIATLKDIERRSKQRAAGLNNSDGLLTWSAIGFRINDYQFITPIEQSKEVFPVPDIITTVPKAAPWVFGIANLRGELLPLFDLKLFLSGKPTKLTRHSRVMVINDLSIYCGVLVDEVYGLKHFEREVSSSVEGIESTFKPLISGSLYQNDILWHLFSLKKLTQNSRFLNAAA